jgi:hypothetical protein
MKRRTMVVAVMGVCILVVGLPALMKFVGIASVRGTVATAGREVAESRVILIQGKDAQAMVHFIAPGMDMQLEGDNTRKWATADPTGRFDFDRVRWLPAGIVGIVEFKDGDLCLTNTDYLQPIIGSYDVELRPTNRCWRRKDGGG